MSDYSAKLTGEPFLYRETKILGSYLLKGYDFDELKTKNIEENLIQHKTTGSLKRTNAPIFRRLESMDKDSLSSLVNGDVRTSKLVLLYSIMKTDLLVKDFIFDVYQEKLVLDKKSINKIDVESWFEGKMMMSKSLSEKSDSTKAKLQQVILKIMQDSELIKKQKNGFEIIRPILSESFINILNNNDDIDYIKALGGNI